MSPQYGIVILKNSTKLAVFDTGYSPWQQYRTATLTDATIAVELLLAGVPIDRVSALLNRQQRANYREALCAVGWSQQE